MIRPHYVGVYQSICTSERMASLANDSARLFFLQLLTWCDSFGRCQASVASLNATVWPMLGKTHKQTEAALHDCAKAGLVRLYVVDGKQYLQVEQWERFGAKVGRPDKRGKGVWPAPVDECGRTSPETDEVVPPRARVGSARIGMDGEESEEGADTPSPEPDPDPWDEAFAAHPKLDTPEARAAVERWERYRVEEKHKLTPTGRVGTLKAYSDRGVAALVAAIDHTIVKGWRGLRDPDPDEIRKPSTNGKNSTGETPEEADIRSRWMILMGRRVRDGLARGVPDYPGYAAAKADLSTRNEAVNA